MTLSNSDKSESETQEPIISLMISFTYVGCCRAAVCFVRSEMVLIVWLNLSKPTYTIV